MADCVFCDIAAGKAPCFRIWEDGRHLAFLSLYPNTPGAAVVIPKAHLDSDVFALPDKELAALTLASKAVAKLLVDAFDDVGRVALVYEGYGVDHAHAKLFPMHGTPKEGWKPILSAIDHTFDTYPGYISSHSAKRADDAELERVAERIRGRL